MNHNKKVLQFVLVVTLSLLIISFAAIFFHIEWMPVKNVSLLGDILTKKNVTQKLSTDTGTVETVIVKDGNKNIVRSYHHFAVADRITSFAQDSSQVALQHFIEKIAALKKGGKKKIRIAFLGDSMIEGDLITSTLRKLLQQEFGGYGVGFVPVKTIADWSTATTHNSGNWQDDDFRTKQKRSSLFISGHTFYANGDAWLEARDNTIDASHPLIKNIFVGHGSASNITYNGSNKEIQANDAFNNILLGNSNGNSIRIGINDNSLPIYGVSFESSTGIILDNFSFRGSGGIEFAKFDSSFLSSIAKNNPYDLIIMQYGINLIEKSSDTKFDWYYAPMKNAVTKIRHSFPDADMLIISSGDRAYRYENGMLSAIGLPNIIAMQEKIAFETNSSFYNLFSSMGGDGSIVNWVNASPPLAYKDYMHPNERGSEVLGRSLFNAVMHEYKKTTNK